MKSKVEPIGDRILVKRLEAEDKTSGGILLPESAKEKPQQGKVLAVGPGKTLDNGKISKMNLKKGSVIFFSSYAGNAITVDDEELIIMREDEVLAIIE